MVPDNVFLEVFKFCLQDSNPTKPPLERTRQWQRLLRVCQRWRKIVFGSSHGPRWLDLQLSCSYWTPVRKNLVFWSDNLPLTLDYPEGCYRLYDENNILFALQHLHRVLRIELLARAPLITKVATALQKSFPALIHLVLMGSSDYFPVIPEKFLGGSAPRLQHLCLSDVDIVSMFDSIAWQKGNRKKKKEYSAHDWGRNSNPALVSLLWAWRGAASSLRAAL
jgi:hypothetical protein